MVVINTARRVVSPPIALLTFHGRTQLFTCQCSEDLAEKELGMHLAQTSQSLSVLLLLRRN
jgi:hypothetical protein